MPIITKISPTRRNPRRQSVHLDQVFSFSCNLNVIARFRLREGLELSAEQIEAIRQGEIRQECFDKAMSYVQLRLHSRSELRTKLLRREFDPATVDDVLEQLIRLNYVNDAQFAKDRAHSAATRKQHGRKRAKLELMRAGVSTADAETALEAVYGSTDSLAVAMHLAERQAPRLRKLDPATARRRLSGMLQRRGFDYEEVKTVVERTLGSGADSADVAE